MSDLGTQIARHSNLSRHFQAFYKALAEKRDGDDHWTENEEFQMGCEVNRLRHEDGKPPVHLNDVRSAFRCATGHSDYFVKVCRYCRDLVMDNDRRSWHV